MQTIAQQLKVIDFPFRIRNGKDNLIYYEDSEGYWYRYEFDSKGNETYCEDSVGYWYKKEYDSKGREIYFENSAGDWVRYEYNSKGEEIYYENSYGTISDNRPKSEIQKALELLEKEGMIVDGKVLKN